MIDKGWHPDFIADLNLLATKWSVPLENVAAAWKKYASDCRDRYDQSALVWEFEQWVANGAYKDLLRGGV